MARKPRIEYEGAVYHVMCRGNGGCDIFISDEDRRQFLDTLEEACARTGWLVHAFCLMGNHYHVLLETPEANLVAGMKWLQGTYTQRFNSRHKRWGHLFQGRYKALLVDTNSGEYFSTLSTYIHLNPARAHLFDLDAGDLKDFRWSSYPLYLDVSVRPVWLCVDRVLGNFHGEDDSVGRRRYRQYMQKRVRELSICTNPSECDPAWAEIRKGWFLGDETFRAQLMDRMDGVMKGKHRSSFSGEQVRGHDLIEAERLVKAGLKVLNLSEHDLNKLLKNCPQKYAVAWLARRNTCVENRWIKDRLQMGRATNFATFLKRMERGDFGEEYFEKVKNIIS